MTYLNSWLLDSAENRLEDFNPSSKNYKLALESLIYRFGNDQVLLSALMKNLINKLKIIKNKSNKELSNYYRFITIELIQ